MWPLPPHLVDDTPTYTSTTMKQNQDVCACVSRVGFKPTIFCLKGKRVALSADAT